MENIKGIDSAKLVSGKIIFDETVQFLAGDKIAIYPVDKDGDYIFQLLRNGETIRFILKREKP